ncbi:hypothetical protein D3C71_1923140 [compost metagenome]
MCIPFFRELPICYRYTADSNSLCAEPKETLECYVLFEWVNLFMTHSLQKRSELNFLLLRKVCVYSIYTTTHSTYWAAFLLHHLDKH